MSIEGLIFGVVAFLIGYFMPLYVFGIVSIIAYLIYVNADGLGQVFVGLFFGWFMLWGLAGFGLNYYNGNNEIHKDQDQNQYVLIQTKEPEKSTLDKIMTWKPFEKSEK